MNRKNKNFKNGTSKSKPQSRIKPEDVEYINSILKRIIEYYLNEDHFTEDDGQVVEMLINHNDSFEEYIRTHPEIDVKEVVAYRVSQICDDHYFVEVLVEKPIPIITPEQIVYLSFWLSDCTGRWLMLSQKEDGSLVVSDYDFCNSLLG